MLEKLRYFKQLSASVIGLLLLFLGTSKTGTAQDSNQLQENGKGLSELFADYFYLGTAIEPYQLDDSTRLLIDKHFNSITAENCMKSGPIHPSENQFNWGKADTLNRYVIESGKRMRGHTLVWHSQAPSWIFIDESGNDVSKEILLARMKAHIDSVMNRYKGTVYCWDVVNEVISDDPSTQYRNSKWYEITGTDFIEQAFRYAHEVDPKARLYYNDYNAANPDKRDRIYEMLKKMVEKGVPINGMGMQAHWSIYEPSADNIRKAIEMYASLGLDIQITELDVSVFQGESSTRNARPEDHIQFSPELEQKQAEYFRTIFKIFMDYKNVIESVTLWGVADNHTWLDHFPVRDRKNWPLLFDENYKPKKAYYSIVELTK